MNDKSLIPNVHPMCVKHPFSADMVARVVRFSSEDASLRHIDPRLMAKQFTHALHELGFPVTVEYVETITPSRMGPVSGDFAVINEKAFIPHKATK